MSKARRIDKGQMLRFGVDEDRRDSAIADIGNDEKSLYVRRVEKALREDMGRIIYKDIASKGI
jgi:hypothetical protein